MVNRAIYTIMGGKISGDAEKENFCSNLLSFWVIVDTKSEAKETWIQVQNTCETG